MKDKPAANQSPTQALLKRLRRQGLTQTEISRRTLIPQPRLSRWEGGDVAVGADDALRLQALEEQLAEKARATAAGSRAKKGRA